MGAGGHVQVHATQIERTLECTLSRSPSGSPAAACPHVARRQNRSTDTGPILGPIVCSITPLFFSFLLSSFPFLFYACSWLFSSQDEPTKIPLPLRCQTSPFSGEDVSINLSKETRTRRFCSIFMLCALLEITLTLWIFFFFLL